MTDLNLEEYFQGDSADRRCPLCDHDSASDKQLVDHLWGHKGENGVVISQKERRLICPFPECENRIFSSPRALSTHVIVHTGEKEYACPHLVAWEPFIRLLCGHRTSSKHRLDAHRVSIHSYDKTQRTAQGPWVKKADTTLSNAQICYTEAGNDDNNDDIPQAHPNPPDNKSQNAGPAVKPEPHNTNIPPPVPPADGPEVHQHGAHPAEMNHGPLGDAAHAQGDVHGVPGDPYF